MTASSPQLVSIGYEGRSVDDLIGVLRDQDVSVLVDVRLNPISRKRGLSKSALAQALALVGIEYIHHRELGNPKDNRDGYRAGELESLARYEGVLATRSARQALHHVSEMLDGGAVALLCFEKEHEQCHRHQVAEALQDLRSELSVTYA